MASLLTSSIVADVRGKVGSEVYERNGAGNYVRTLGSWVQPDTQRQLDQRAAITALSQAWSGTLTEVQRASWKMYARQHPRVNKWGVRSNCSGYNRFVRANSYRYRQNSSIDYLVAPEGPPLHPPIFTFTADAGADTLTVGLPPGTYTPPWAGLRLWVFAGRGVGSGVSYYRAPWRYVGLNTYNGAWTSDPWTENLPWAIDVGDKVFAYLVAQHAVQGNLSSRCKSSYQT